MTWVMYTEQTRIKVCICSLTPLISALLWFPLTQMIGWEHTFKQVESYLCAVFCNLSCNIRPPTHDIAADKNMLYNVKLQCIPMHVNKMKAHTQNCECDEVLERLYKVYVWYMVRRRFVKVWISYICEQS